MSINQKDIKLLWGRSGNKCAFCKCDLSSDKKAVTSSFTLGEQAHIIGEKDTAPRGKSRLTEAERNSYHNLILLCPTHHTEIDKNEEDWPVEKLHLIKSEHELWVSETLSLPLDLSKNASQLSISLIVDSAVNICRLEEWKNWTSFALSPNPTWPKDFPDEIFEFRQKVIGAIFPDDFPQIKKSIITFSILIHSAAQKFLKNSEEKNGNLIPYKFYKANGWNDNYHKDVVKYENWISECHELLIEATKAANWFADSVRIELNPMFFIEKGKFIVMQGPFSDLTFGVKLYEFDDIEKENLPNKLLKEV